MLNQTIPQKQFRLSCPSQQREKLTRKETNADIREAINAGSASRFVVSRLEWFIERGLDTSREVL